MEVCPPELHLPASAGLKPTYSVLHGDRPATSEPAARGLISTDHAVVLGQGDAAGRRAGLAAQDRLGVQERALGASRGALGASGGRVDAARRALDARERQLGAQAAVLAAPGGRTLDAGPGDLAAGRADGRVGRQWRSESDLAGSEEAAAAPDSPGSDSEADLPRRRQEWRSETHLAPGGGSLSQRYRSQPCLLSARPDYSGVSSRVAAYIRRRRQQDRTARARRRRDSCSPDRPPEDAADREDADGGDCRELAARLAAERAERRERERQLEQLQTDYEHLVTKYAEAETYIDKMRFQRPGSEAIRPAFRGRSDWEGGGRAISSPNETPASQNSRFSRFTGVKSASIRRYSDEEYCFRRFVRSKKELFPDGVGSKDSSFSDRRSGDLNVSVKNHLEDGHSYDLHCSPVSAAAAANLGDSPSPDLTAAVWGPTSAPPDLTRGHRGRPPSADHWESGQTDRPGADPSPDRGAGGRLASPGSPEIEAGPRRQKMKATVRDRGIEVSGGLDVIDVSVGKSRSRESSRERQRIRGLSPEHLEKSRDVSPEHRRQSCDSVPLSLPESRDQSVEGGLMSAPSRADSELSTASVSSRDVSLEHRRSSRGSDSPSQEGSDQSGHTGNRELHQLSSQVTEDSGAGLQSISRGRRSRTRSRSHDEASKNHPSMQGLSSTASPSSLISESNDPSKSFANSPISHSPSSVSKTHTPSKSPLLFPADPAPPPRRRRRSSSDPGHGRRAASPPETPATPPRASRDRLQGVLSVLASQVEVIQAMVGRRGRAARRCRSLSRRISRNRVSVSPGSVGEAAGVGGLGRKADGVRGGRRGRGVEETEGRCEGSDRSPGAGEMHAGLKLEGRRSVSEADGRQQGHGTAPDCSASPPLQPADRSAAASPPSGPAPVRRRHPAGSHLAPALDNYSPPGDRPPERPEAPSAGRRHPAPLLDSSPPGDRPPERPEAPSASRRPAPTLDSSLPDDRPPSTGRRGTQVPPLALSELESERGDRAGSCCSTVSPRTVSPTRKVEQWRARLADLSPEPPSEDPPSPSCPPGGELRRLAGAVRGLQRQMSGFSRLVDQLRGPPLTPGSPGSSEASGVRRRRRYLRERRGLQLPLLPDKPAPPAPAAARRWDIRRPPARRAASCERAVQTEAEGQKQQGEAQTRPAGTRSDGESPPAAVAAQRYLDSGGASHAHWDRANLLAREVNLRSRCILEGVIRSTAC